MHAIFASLKVFFMRSGLLWSLFSGWAGMPLAVHAEKPATQPAGRIKLMSWNMEWLILPESFETLKQTCIHEQPPTERRALPCNVKGRIHEDFEALARYAARLDADVIAVQEVDNPAAARRVFGKKYKADCFTSRRHPQNTGFVIRTTIAYRCNPEFQALDLNGQTRSAADITVFPGSASEMRLLSVHLKSGCFRERLDNKKNRSCQELREQVPVLEKWVDARVKEGARFAILGDFNRRLEFDAQHRAGDDESAPLNIIAALSDNNPPGATLIRITENQPYIKCHASDRYKAYIDNVLLSESLARDFPQKTMIVQPFEEQDSLKFKLSDHCPIGVQLSR